MALKIGACGGQEISGVLAKVVTVIPVPDNEGRSTIPIARVLTMVP